MAMPRSTIVAAGSAPIGRPSKRTASAALRMTPAMERRSVVLPAPLAPMIATVSPALERDVDAEQRLEVAVEGRQAPGLEEGHQTSIPR